MAGENNNEIFLQDNEDLKSFEEALLTADARPLCPRCLKPCSPLQYYCDNCASNEVINPLASYMPFVRIRFNAGMIGKLGWKILYDIEISIVYRLLLILMLIAAILLFPGSVC